jgi:hypothetical protein
LIVSTISATEPKLPQDDLLAEVAKETFDHVQPGSAGRGEVELKARMTAPASGGPFDVCASSSIHDQMNA